MTDKPTISDWKALSEKEVKGRDLTWQTPEGIAVKPLYTAEDVKDIDSGLPGFGPFTRGVRGSMYAGQPWTIRQYAGFSTAEESNAFYRSEEHTSELQSLMRISYAVLCLKNKKT